MTGIGRARRQAYRVARDLGDVDAALKGPVPLARRQARKYAYRKGNSLIRKFRWPRPSDRHPRPAATPDDERPG